MVGERGSGSAGLQAIAELLGALGARGTARASGEPSGVADTVEQLRQQIDELIRRIAAGGESAGIDRSDPPGLEHQMEALGRKVDGASDLLAELTDILESQAERIETLEHQFGDPDTGSPKPSTPTEPVRPPPPQSVQGGAAACAFADAPDARAPDALRVLLETRLDRLEQRIGGLEEGVSEVRRVIAERDRQVGELEERLLILVDVDRSDAAASTPGAAAPVPVETPASARLAELVEREVQTQREFAPGAVIARAASPGAKAHPTVMVIDDSADARTVLSIYLSKTGYHVVTAVSAEDGLAKLRNHDVDAIVVDALMAGASGEHVCNVIRKDSAYASRRNLPIIVYTGHTEQFSRERVLAWGADDYVVKGRDMLGLMAALVRHTRGSDPTEARA